MKKIIDGLLFTMASSAAFAQDNPENAVIKVGKPAPELAFPNPEGQVLKLSEITKGRIVYLDFWASWCGPCRRASPEVVALYNKYKDAKFKNAKNGFTVVSVSLDQNKEAWIGAIQQDGLIWPFHMSDLGQWKSQAVGTYGIQYIPQAFLVGPDGKIIAKYGFGQHPDEDLKKLLKKG
jgi:thiol-disulfide isomerase/thioredoxin